MSGRDFGKGSRSDGPHEEARFHQGHKAPLQPMDYLRREGYDRPEVGERWRDCFGMAMSPCSAKTRGGWACRNPGAGVGGRCRLHGDASTGPRTAEGKKRSAQNARRRDVDAPAAPAAAPAVTHPVSRPALESAPPQPRVTFLDKMLDRALAGDLRWPVLDRLLQAAGGEHPPTRAEAVALTGLPAAGRIIDRLIERGVMSARAQGRRLVLVRMPPPLSRG